MGTVTALKPAILVAFRRHLRLLEREMARQLESETDCCGVTLAQCHALLELSASEASLSSLAASLDLDTSTLSRTIEGLVRADLVERVPVPSDRRSVRLSLTAAGKAKVAQIDQTCNRYYGALLAVMKERDQQTVLRGVELLAERMASQRAAKAGGIEEERNGKK